MFLVTLSRLFFAICCLLFPTIFPPHPSLGHLQTACHCFLQQRRCQRPSSLLLSPVSLPSPTAPGWKMTDVTRSPTAASSLSRPNVAPNYRPRRPSEGRFSSPYQTLSEEEQRSFEVRRKQVWPSEGAPSTFDERCHDHMLIL